MTPSDRVRNLKVKFKEIRIDHPRLQDAHVRLDEMLEVAKLTSGQAQTILPIIGPTGSGKTTTFKSWAETVKPDVPGGAHPVLHVTLSAKSTVKQLGVDILHALGRDGLPFEVIDDLAGRQTSRRVRKRGSFMREGQPQVIYAATTALVEAGIQLLAIDEIHHIVYSDGAVRTAWSVSETLKVMAESGIPIVVIGTYAARRVLDASNNPQFTGRCDVPIVLDPLDLSFQDEARLFAGYVAAIGSSLGAKGIFDRSQDLIRQDFLACFYDVSGGVIGTVSRLIRTAAEHALRRGGQSIEREDLSAATRRWAIALKITDHDPWTAGPRDFKIARARVAQ